MGVFEFILLIVLITTLGKIIESRTARPQLPKETDRSDDIRLLEESVGDLHARLEKLEQERDFYRDLLDPPDRPGGSLPPGPNG